MSEIIRPTPGRWTLLWRGATRACPVCGQRHLTRRVVSLTPECPRCGFVFERHSGHFVGGVMMATIVTFGLILISFLISLWVTWPDVNFLSLAAVPLAIAVTLPVLFNASFRTLWIGIDLMMNPLEPGEATRNFDPVTGRDVVVVGTDPEKSST